MYRPVVVVPSYGYNGINSPYFGFGNSSYGNQFVTPVYGYNRGYGYNNGYGYNSPGVLNIGYSRPGFGINFGTIIR